MIRLGEKIQISISDGGKSTKEVRHITIWNNALVLSSLYDDSWEREEIIKYEDFVELAEIKKTVLYGEVFYYDENGREHLLVDKEIVEIEYQLCLQYKKDVKVSVYSSETKNETVYANLLIDNLDLGLEIVKKINRYIKKIIQDRTIQDD